MKKEEAQVIIAKALEGSRAEHCEVMLSGISQGSTRLSNNAITQNIARSDATLEVVSAFGQKKGKASTNDFSSQGIASCLARAEEIARHSEPDTEYLPPVGHQTYQDCRAYFQATEAFTPEDRAKAIREACGILDR